MLDMREGCQLKSRHPRHPSTQEEQEDEGIARVSKMYLSEEKITCYSWKVEADLERASSDRVFKRQISLADN